ncbi:aspartate/tyrosine/aromatic aminotransferase [Acidiphilium sp. AL]|uniref:amino acid aminotransferase n=1 Tax=Acidiphilium sp. AL TaxID=2871704 RepID=UPI0021CB4635|nr:amino acid aminotransferase [Acidiphilium sp. AL]MCU4161843.1 aspartate/tyrosine/aromatic aminotransferase [Acidiphilium sp. AL]
MFETLSPAQPDKILALIGLFRDDPRPGKLDLGVGVYKDENGRTPVLGAVREAEERLLSEQDTKSYVGPAGDLMFNAAMVRLLFGSQADTSRIRACQAPGGSGALRIVLQLLRLARPAAAIWIPDPSWPNHAALVEAVGAELRSYPYFDPATGEVSFGAMIDAVKSARPGDVVLLQGCCHNPIGADLDPSQWSEVADLIVERGLFPFVDIAYQGFGDGLDADALGLRLIASRAPELAVAASCSKNFGVYRDRVGAAIIVSRTATEADNAIGQLLSVTRSMYSMPPDHGAAAVRIVLDDARLRSGWETELEGMRRRMVRLRQGFVEALQRQSNTSRFDFLARQRGMFSRIGATPEQVERLRMEHAVYLVGDGRINVAGLPETRLDEVAKAVVSVLDGFGC